jgi:hypothetical protein
MTINGKTLTQARKEFKRHQRDYAEAEKALATCTAGDGWDQSCRNDMKWAAENLAKLVRDFGEAVLPPALAHRLAEAA